MAQKRDYYEILGVSSSASNDEIKKAYRKLAIKYHPDKNQGNKEAENYFKEATEAYEILSSTEKRKMYDQYGFEGLNAASGAGGHDFSSVFREFKDIFEGGSFEGFFSGGGGGESIFDSIFGINQNRKKRDKRDIRVVMRIRLEDAVNGSEKKFSYEKYIECDSCGGSGSEKGSSVQTCQHCGGSGMAHSSGLGGFFSFSSTCGHCGGSGKIIVKKCRSCRGEGSIVKRQSVKVRIPSGSNSHDTLSLTGMGHEIEGGKGDVNITLEIQPHNVYIKDHNDLIAYLPVDFITATIGGSVYFTSITGERLHVPIPPHSEDAKTIRIKRKGISGANTFTGDMLVVIKIVSPQKISRHAMELLKKLKEEIGDDHEVSPLTHNHYE